MKEDDSDTSNAVATKHCCCKRCVLDKNVDEGELDEFCELGYGKCEWMTLLLLLQNNVDAGGLFWIQKNMDVGMLWLDWVNFVN